jgi:hypothetical protein
VTALGIVAVVGLLADRLYLLKVDSFIGIKVAQLIPVLLAAIIVTLNLRASTNRPFEQAVGNAHGTLTRLAASPVLIWQVAAALVVLVVLALLVLRSGNDPGVGVSGLELKIRSLLDRLLYSRPRFKEFLIGHPALILALLFASRRNFPPLVLTGLFLVGAIGQASFLNTFCHIHTPLLISLARALLGVFIGVIIGLVLYFLFTFVERRFIRSVPPPSGANAR